MVPKFKHLLFLSCFFLTSLVLGTFLAPSAFADQSYTDTYTSVSGQYGAKVGSTYYRYSSFSGNLPVELITGSGSTAKYLYGVAAAIPINVRQQAYSYWYQGSFTLTQNSTNNNSTSASVFNTNLPIEATITFADRTTEVTTDCGFQNPDRYSVIALCAFESTKVPTQMYITYGTVGQFNDAASNALAYYSSAFNDGSIRLTASSVEVREYSTEGSATSGAINNLGDTMDDIHQDEKDTINQNAEDAQNAADGLNIGFSVANPLTVWFELFTDQPCVDIPTISSWLHANETQVCSPWRNTPVRAVASPIMGVLGGMILFGFIVRWLKGNGFDGSIELNG